MSLVGIQLDNGGVLLKFVQTSAETGGALHVQEARYPPHSPRPPLHRHPRQEERFSIVTGTLSFRVGDTTRLLQTGDEITVPIGALHAAYNPGEVHAVVLWETRPALRTAEFFVTMDRALRGRTRPRLIDAAAILSEYREEFQLAKPAPFIQRVVFGCLAPFGRAALR
ncbi:MAG TPA: cupin domain-containing protein [Polyangiales bacterium]|nr:cupin domain-containing protein [Polyangiales bacterium]